MSLVYEGRAWKFGDALVCDGDMVPLEHVFARENRPEVLRPVLFAGIDPTIAGRIVPGDIVVAGCGFGCGHAHPQAAYALAAAGVGVIAASIPRGHFRNLVMMAVPFLTDAAEAVALAAHGDRLRVDFATGVMENLSSRARVEVEPLSPMPLETIAIGGWKPMMRRRLDAKRTTG